MTFGIVASCTSLASAQERIWYAESDNSDDFFGQDFVVVPDVNSDGLADLLIGAYGATCTKGGDGIVHLFSTETGGELEQWCGVKQEAFGASVASIGDVDGGGIPDFLVSGPYYPVPTLGAEDGRVVIFSAETYAQLLEVDATQLNQRLGSGGIAGLPDLNGDGFPEILVGSPSYSSGASGIGKVYVFSSKDGSVVREQVGEAAQDFFGERICAMKDADGDGVGDYAVYASLDPVKSGQVGKVYVYSGATGALVQSWKGSGGAQLGGCLVPSDDLDGDGLADVCFGVNGTLHYQFRAYSAKTGAQIFNVDGSGVTTGFAHAAAMSLGDMNRDGVEEFAVATIYDTHDGRDAGKVTLYSGKTLRPLYDFYPGYKFGFFGTAIQGGNTDFNHDRIPDLVISAPGTRFSTPKGGRVSVFAGNDLFLQADKTDPKPNTNVTLDVRGGPAGALVMDVVVDVDGSPVWEPITLTTLDGNGELADVESVPTDASGHDFSLIAYSIDTRGKLVDTSTVDISVQ